MSNESISLKFKQQILDLKTNEESKISNISNEKNNVNINENNLEEDEKITNLDFDSGKGEYINLNNQSEQKNQEISLIKPVSERTENNESKNNKKKN